MTGWLRPPQEALELAVAHAKLQAVAGREADWTAITIEVEHRARLAGMTALGAAQSVYEDITSARWRP
jgi:hypothetical protein